jgi:hypothetical protein
MWGKAYAALCASHFSTSIQIWNCACQLFSRSATFYRDISSLTCKACSTNQVASATAPGTCVCKTGSDHGLALLMQRSWTYSAFVSLLRSHPKGFVWTPRRPRACRVLRRACLRGATDPHAQPVAAGRPFLPLLEIAFALVPTVCSCVFASLLFSFV